MSMAGLRPVSGSGMGVRVRPCRVAVAASAAVPCRCVPWRTRRINPAAGIPDIATRVIVERGIVIDPDVRKFLDRATRAQGLAPTSYVVGDGPIKHKLSGRVRQAQGRVR